MVTSQPAGRRIPFQLWLVSGDALDERDATTVPEKSVASSFAAALVDILVTTRRIVCVATDAKRRNGHAYSIVSAMNKILRRVDSEGGLAE